MTTFFLYLMKSVLCLALFYPFYMVLLSRETFHRFNRMALIGILLAAALIPACRITTEEPMLLSQLYQRWEHWLTGQEVETATATIDVNWDEMDFAALPITDYTSEVAAPFSLSDFLSEHWGDLLFLLYVAGILFLIGRHIASLVRLFGLLRQGKMQRLDDGTRLYLHPRSDIAPFSWMKYIVISEADYLENGRQIVVHERAHISNRHSWDLLLVEVCLMAQWFNPAAWLLRQELQNIHEYEADDTVLRQGINAKEYQLLIIKKAVGARLYSLANSLNHSSLKKRLTMMMKEKSHPWARLKYLYVLPLAAISLVAFAHTEAANNSNGISEAKGTEVSVNSQTSSVKSSEKDGKVLIIVDGKLTIQETESIDWTEEDLAKHIGVAPEEIAQIEVIKKPEVLAQWNIPGATGAILVTTKKAKAANKEADPDKEKFTVTINDAGEYSYGPMGGTLKKGTLDDICQYIRDMQRKLQADGGGKHFLVNVEASPKAPKESVEKVKETLRKAWALRITYSQQEEKETVVDHLILIGKPEYNEQEGHLEVDEVEEVFAVVENMPEFPGGTAEMMKYLAKNLKYPAEAQQKGEQGRVMVQFVVGKDGKLGDVKIARSISPTLDAEAIRVVKAMPAWKPGTQRGQAVAVKYNIPISFRLNGNEGENKPAANVIQAIAASEDLHGPKQVPASCIVLVDSKGGYKYETEGEMKNGSLEDVANYVNDRRKESNSAGNGAHFKVQLVADENAPQESVDKLKEALRKIHVLQINYHKEGANNKGDSDEVFQVVEKMPQFPGGMGELMNYLTKNVKYPKAAMEDSIQGRVIVQFVISKTGKVTNPSIMRSVSPELDAEAIRVVSSMPLWTPGEQKGVPVNVQFTLPIQFRLMSPKDKKQ